MYLCCFHCNNKDLELTLQISNHTVIINLTSNLILIFFYWLYNGLETFFWPVSLKFEILLLSFIFKIFSVC